MTGYARSLTAIAAAGTLSACVWPPLPEPVSLDTTWLESSLQTAGATKISCTGKYVPAEVLINNIIDCSFVYQNQNYTLGFIEHKESEQLFGQITKTTRLEQANEAPADSTGLLVSKYPFDISCSDLELCYDVFSTNLSLIITLITEW